MAQAEKSKKQGKRRGEDSKGVPLLEPKHYFGWVKAHLSGSPLKGGTYAITGCNSGLGFWAATALRYGGATVVALNRSEQRTSIAKAQQDVVLAELNALAYSGPLEHVTCDLLSFDSVRTAARKVKRKHKFLNGLLLNGGIMMSPRENSSDGWDTQLQTNHLSHFLLASELFEPVKRANGRIVTHTSMAHGFGRINFDDLNAGESRVPLSRYLPLIQPSNRYSQSKLANMLFANELSSRLKSHDIPNVLSVAAHPGYASTDLQRRAILPGWKMFNRALGQSAEDGSLPLLQAAVGKEVQSGDFWGPEAKDERKGIPKKVKPRGDGANEKVARWLWEETERATGVQFL